MLTLKLESASYLRSARQSSLGKTLSPTFFLGWVRVNYCSAIVVRRTSPLRTIYYTRKVCCEVRGSVQDDVEPEFPSSFMGLCPFIAEGSNPDLVISVRDFGFWGPTHPISNVAEINSTYSNELT